MNAHISEQDLLQYYYTDRNNKWLGILLQRYTLLLFGVCMKYLKDEEEAKDAVQQIFLKVITELEKYKVDYFKSWLYMVAKNHCLMRLRDKKNNRPVELKDEVGGVRDDRDEQLRDLQERDLTLEMLENSLSELSGEQRECVTLFYLRKRSYQEIAETTGYSLLQVKSYIQNGKRNLRLLVEKKLRSQAGVRK